MVPTSQIRQHKPIPGYLNIAGLSEASEIRPSQYCSVRAVLPARFLLRLPWLPLTPSALVPSVFAEPGRIVLRAIWAILAPPSGPFSKKLLPVHLAPPRLSDPLALQGMSANQGWWNSLFLVIAH